MTQPSMATAEHHAHALLRSQCDTLRRHIDGADRLSLVLLGQRPPTEATLKALIAVTHDIACGAGAMGFDSLSRNASALERLAAGSLRNAAGLTAQAARNIRALARPLPVIGQALTPEQVALRQSLMLRKSSLRLE